MASCMAGFSHAIHFRFGQPALVPKFATSPMFEQAMRQDVAPLADEVAHISFKVLAGLVVTCHMAARGQPRALPM